ncbi:phage portal protein [Oceanobacillus luteolus]|uniref:phage portal protein n=1 Tax=Oceanobacillus luteolus TaxID=1274358 RepID=UPI00203C19BA|nr:phage portal protein [Oceanobacillus luteolus]MCM3739225.1 phage portal protein [Oceanobacillus luteolus]
MYPMTETETERIGKQLQAQKPDIKMIEKLIERHDTTKMREGIRYYENENDVLQRNQYAVIDGVKMIDHEKPNNRIPHGWHKLLVDQKVAYLVGQPINFSTDDEDLLKYINQYLGEKFDDIANELVKNASNKGKEWLHPYIDENGEFDYTITPAEQCIPIYEDKRQTKLEYMIRYYPVVLGEKEVIQVELWSKEDVTYFILEDSTLLFDTSELVNPASHFYFVKNQQETGYGWGKVPFIPFRNNEQEKSDLHYYKQLIDAFDLKVSDNQNSFEEIQELIYVLKGYEGQSLSEFMQNLKYYKAVNVDGDGGVDTIQGEIPMTSIDSHLDRLRESIYTFGQGVDVQTDKFGNAPSGIALKFLYSLLDLKSDTLERKFRVGIQELIWFLCEYLSMSNLGEHDYKSVDYTFKRSMITNDLENADIAQKSKGIISDETIVNHHPWVDNVEREMERLKKEKQERDSLVDLDDESDDEIEGDGNDQAE